MKTLSLILSLLLFFLLTTLHSTRLIAQVANVQDSLSLWNFYHACDGSNSTLNWASDLPVKSWTGVGLNSSGRVIRLEVGNRRLQGTLPNALGTLTSLQKLNLSSNKFSGGIDVITSLTGLLELYIQGNNFSGLLPNSIQKWAVIEKWNASANSFEGNFPPSIGTLSKLREFNISNNALSGTLIPNIGQLSNLEILNLSINNFNGEIPSTLGNLSKLKELNLSRNRFTGSIPADLGGLIKLEIVILSQNSLTGGLSDEHRNWSNLKQFIAVDNKLEAPLLSVLLSCHNLEVINVQKNQILESIPENIHQLSKLQTFILQNNLFSGLLPTNLIYLTDLVKIDLSKNEFYGEIPEFFGFLTNLEYWSFADNNIIGLIPPSIKNLTKLKYLDLSRNDLTGYLPTDFGDMRALEYLNLSYNGLDGNLPASFIFLVELNYMNLSFNRLKSSQNAALAQLVKLTYLDMSNNNIRGGVPENLGNLVKLTYCSFAYNELFSRIPESIGGCTELKTLRLEHNKIYGAVPQTLDSLHQLQTLTLNNNDLTDLPKLTGLYALKNFQVQNNRLTFEDLEPNTHISTTFIYAPQQSVPVDQPCILEVHVGGIYNHYQWYFNYLAKYAEKSPLIAVQDTGRYYCLITNDSLPLLRISSDTIYIERHTQPMLDLGPDTLYICDPTFSVTLNPGGNADFYTWNTGDTSRTITVSQEGMYTVSVGKSICYTSDTIYLKYTGIKENIISEDQVVCYGSIPDSLRGNAGKEGQTYLWQSSPNNSIWRDEAHTQNFLPPFPERKMYYRRIMSSTGCPSRISNVVQLIPSEVQVKSYVTHVTCNGDDNGSIRLSLEGGVGPLSVVWFDGSTSLHRKELKAGKYSFTVKDSTFCDYPYEIEVTEPEALTITYEYSPVGCTIGDKDGSIRVKVSGGTAPYRYQWEQGYTSSFVSGLGFLGESVPYTVHVSDQNNCIKTVDIYLPQKETRDASFSYDKEIYCEFDFSPIPSIQGVEGGKFYCNQEGIDLDSITGEINIVNSKENVYTILYSLDECSTMDVKVDIRKHCESRIPNTITPNLDGINDVWEVRMLESYPMAIVKIYTSDGKEVFVSEPGYPEPWNARLQGYDLPGGTYYYFIDLKDSTANQKEISGFISVVRE